MTTDIGAFIWYELITPDPIAAKAFYDSVVGWDIATESLPSEPDYRLINRADGGPAGGLLKLNDEMQQHGARPKWLGYVQVSDVDAEVAAIEAEGGKAMMSAFDAPGVGRIAMMTDPQGAPFYIMKPVPPADASADAVSDVFSVDQAQHVRWNELASDDQDGAIDFYTRRFGWTQEGGMDMGPTGTYKFIEHDGTMIGAIMPKPKQMPASQWTFYIDVDDIDRAATAVREGGGTVRVEPMEIPGGEYSLEATDPQGAAFGLVGLRKGGAA